MHYLTTNTRQKLNLIINKLNNKELVTLSERILLSKYSTRFPSIVARIKEKSIKSF